MVTRVWLGTSAAVVLNGCVLSAVLSASLSLCRVLAAAARACALALGSLELVAQRGDDDGDVVLGAGLERVVCELARRVGGLVAELVERGSDRVARLLVGEHVPHAVACEDDEAVVGRDTHRVHRRLGRE